MKITMTLLTALSLLFYNASTAQEFNAPSDYQLNSKEDYAKHEKNIINAANWLLTTPLNEQSAKRKEVSAFVVKCINGSPTVNVELNPTVMDFDKKNGGMLVLFMASSAKFVLENNYSTTCGPNTGPLFVI